MWNEMTPNGAGVIATIIPVLLIAGWLVPGAGAGMKEDLHSSRRHLRFSSRFFAIYWLTFAAVGIYLGCQGAASETGLVGFQAWVTSMALVNTLAVALGAWIHQTFDERRPPADSGDPDSTLP